MGDENRQASDSLGRLTRGLTRKPVEGEFPPVDLSREGLSNRLREVMVGDTQTNFARKIGVAQTTLSSYLAGSTEPSWSVLLRIAAVSGRSVAWLMTGEVPPSMGSAPTPRSTSAKPDVVPVPIYDIRASAGPGASSGHEEPAVEVDIDRRFLRILGIKPQNAAVLVVHGDSAEPNLSEGDSIVLDKSFSELRDGGLYVIAVDSDLILKRIERQFDGSVVLKSDNPAYAPQRVPANELDQLRVIGRVRWALHQL